MSKSITVLGSTGSIGLSTLDLIERAPKGDFTVTGLCANQNVERLTKQALQFRPKAVAIADSSKESELVRNLQGEGIEDKL